MSEIDIGKDPLTGKRKQKKKRGFETKKEAEKALAALLNELNEGTYIEPSKQLYIDYFNEWLISREHQLSLRNTVKENKNNYNLKSSEV